MNNRQQQKTVTSESSLRPLGRVRLYHKPDSRHYIYVLGKCTPTESESNMFVASHCHLSLWLSFSAPPEEAHQSLSVCFVKVRRALVTTQHSVISREWLIFGWYLCESTSVGHKWVRRCISCLDPVISHITVWKVADASYCYYDHCVALLLIYFHISNRTSRSH